MIKVKEHQEVFLVYLHHVYFHFGFLYNEKQSTKTPLAFLHIFQHFISGKTLSYL